MNMETLVAIEVTPDGTTETITRMTTIRVVAVAVVEITIRMITARTTKTPYVQSTEDTRSRNVP